MGLSGMRERAAALGGQVIMESNGIRGTSLTVALPLATVTAAPASEQS
jgi:signal transduction histidine kinase